MNLPADVLKPSSPPGRGLLQGAVLQVAILGSRTDVGSQTRYLSDLAQEMLRAGVPVAPPIARLPESFPLEQLPPTLNSLPVIALVAATLEPQPFVPEGAMIVSGPPMSGRSSAMRAIATALRRWRPDIRLHLFTASARSSLLGLDLWTTTAGGAEEVAATAKTLVDELAAPGRVGISAVFVESVGEFVEGPASNPMTELLRTAMKAGVFVVAEGESGTLTSTMSPLPLVKASRYGLALAPDTQDGDRIFRTAFPNRLPRADFPVGRALFVHGGKTSVVQIGLAEGGRAEQVSE
jgi:S-DNA-T family DNA segregation ATPase FtsK/SpoIIIE